MNTKPRETLTGRGSQFWRIRRGESSFTAYCGEKGMKHVLAGISRPTTLGRVVISFGTYDLERARFALHWKFIQYYDYGRPHMVLDYSTRAEIYFGSVPNVMG